MSTEYIQQVYSSSYTLTVVVSSQTVVCQTCDCALHASCFAAVMWQLNFSDEITTISRSLFSLMLFLNTIFSLITQRLLIGIIYEIFWHYTNSGQRLRNSWSIFSVLGLSHVKRRMCSLFNATAVPIVIVNSQYWPLLLLYWADEDSDLDHH